MELKGRLIKHTIQMDDDGIYKVLKYPYYIFVLEDQQTDYCCENVSGYFQFIKFLATTSKKDISIKLAQFYIIGSPSAKNPNPQPIILPFNYCPSCGEPFSVKVVKNTSMIQIKKIETTYQEVEVDDDGTKIGQ